MFGFNNEKKKAELVALGLPEAAASAAVATDNYFGCPSSKYGPTTTFYTHVVKPDGDVEAAKKAFNAYAKAAKNSKKHRVVSHSYNPPTRELISIETMEGPEVMQNHIGNCFPPYTKILAAGVEMTECVCICPKEETQWWEDSLKVWGAKRFVVTGNHV